MANPKARQLNSVLPEEVPILSACVLDGNFVTYVIIPSSAPRTKFDVGMVLQFAKDLAERPESNAAATTTFVIPGDSAAPHDLKALFRQWRE